MSIFNFFKSAEEKYYLVIKKNLIKSDGENITIGILRLRVFTLIEVIKNITDSYNVNETKLTDIRQQNLSILIDYKLPKESINSQKLMEDKQEEIKLTLTVLFKIKHRCENDFYNAVVSKVSELRQDRTWTEYYNYEEINKFISGNIPREFDKCIIFSNKLSELFWTYRHINDEIITDVKLQI